MSVDQVKSFRQAVLTATRKIPRGQTRSYSEVAVMAGRPRAYRAVGTILAANYDPTVPCHRVICADGRLGQYNRGIRRKRQLLRDEGALT